MDFSNFNLEALKRWTSPQAIKDFDKFLDSIPLNVGYNAIIAVAMMWVIAAGSLYFANVQADEAMQVKKQLLEIKSLKPPVPTVEYKAVDRKDLEKFAEIVSGLYKGLNVNIRGGGQVVVSAQDTDFFPQFISSISYFQRGAKNWKVDISEMCVGRDCKGSKLIATLKVQTVRITQAEM